MAGSGVTEGTLNIACAGAEAVAIEGDGAGAVVAVVAVVLAGCGKLAAAC